MIIGITGRAQCGKNTLASAIAEACRGTYRDRHMVGYVQVDIRAFADALRDVVEAAFGRRYESAEAKAAVDHWWHTRLARSASTFPQYEGPGRLFDGADITGRQVLQKVGTELFRERVHPDFWLFAMESRIVRSTSQHHVVADVRFDNEADWIRRQGGRVVGLYRADQGPVTDPHASERGVDPSLVHESHRCASPAEVRLLGAAIASAWLLPIEKGIP